MRLKNILKIVLARTMVAITSIAVISGVVGTIRINNANAGNMLNDVFYQTGINFYNPNDCGDECGMTGRAGLLPGDSDPELVWNSFVKANIPGISDNPAALAALIGNCKAESGCAPFTHVSGSNYWGLFQTTTSAIQGPLEAQGISLSSPYWGYPAPDAPKEEKEKCIAAQIEALKENSDFIDFIKNAEKVSHKNGADAAGAFSELFTVTYERCVCAFDHFGIDGWNENIEKACNGNEIQDEGVRQVVSDMYGSANYDRKYQYQAVNTRRQGAIDAFNEYALSGSSVSASTDSSSVNSASDEIPSIDGSDITYIGDSYSENSKALLEKALLGADIYAKCSKNFGTATSESDVTGGDFSIASGCVDDFSFSPGGTNWSGIHILKYLKDKNKLRGTVVMALGTNRGYGDTAPENIKLVMDIIGENRKLILMTANTLKGADYAKNNENIKQAINDYPGRVAVADWHSLSSGDTSLFGSDGIHPEWTGEAKGNKAFVKLIVDAISGLRQSNYNADCKPTMGVSGGEALATAAEELSWTSDDKGRLKATSGRKIETKTSTSNYYLYAPRKTNGTLMVYLSDSTTWGNDIAKLKNESLDNGFAKAIFDGRDFNAYIMMVQRKSTSGEWTNNEADALTLDIRNIIKSNGIDPSRVHLIGLGDGAQGAATIYNAEPSMFASISILNAKKTILIKNISGKYVRIFCSSNSYVATACNATKNNLSSTGAKVEYREVVNSTNVDIVRELINNSEYGFVDWYINKTSASSNDPITNALSGTPNDTYRDAAKNLGGTFMSNGNPVISSSRFVSLAILQSGADSEFNALTMDGDTRRHLDTKEIIAHIEQSSNWQKLYDYDSNGYDGKLEPGDLLYREESNHIFIYLGDGKVAEATDSNGIKVAPIAHEWSSDYSLNSAISFDNNGFVAYRLTTEVESNNATSDSDASTTKGVVMSNPIVSEAIKLSWPEGDNDKKSMTSNYKDVFADKKIAQKNNDSNWKKGLSSYAFMATVIAASNVDSEFKYSIGEMLEYLTSSASWEEISAGDELPGDIRFLFNNESEISAGNAHVEIIISDKAGNLKVASAKTGTNYAAIRPYEEDPSAYSGMKIFRNTGDSTDQSNLVADTCGGSSGGIANGGFKSTEEAEAVLRQVYIDEFFKVVPNQYIYEMEIDNCVAYSQFFIQKYTTMDLGKINNVGLSHNGNTIAYHLYSDGIKTYPKLKESKVPVVYSISSWGAGSRWVNHTGVIVGIQGKEVFVAEAAYGNHGYYVHVNAYDYDQLVCDGCYYVDINAYMKSGEFK